MVRFFYGVGNEEKDYITVLLPKEGKIKTEDIAFCQKCYSHVYAKGVISQIYIRI